MNTGGEVLLVEDNSADIQLTRHVMAEENASCSIHVARDRDEALCRIFGEGRYSGARKPAFSLVLLDLKLPKLNGPEVLKEIKSLPATRPLLVVVLSSSYQHEDIDSSYRLDANDVQKPVNFEEFRDAIRRVVVYWLELNLPPSQALLNALSRADGEDPDEGDK